jgi:hypothetical protein
MSPAPWKLAGVLLLMLVTAGGVWKVQDWRYSKQMAEQASLRKDDLNAISNAAAAQVRADQDKRLACGFHRHPATHSMSIRPLIPR